MFFLANWYFIAVRVISFVAEPFTSLYLYIIYSSIASVNSVFLTRQVYKERTEALFEEAWITPIGTQRFMRRVSIEVPSYIGSVILEVL